MGGAGIRIILERSSLSITLDKNSGSYYIRSAMVQSYKRPATRTG